jgi:hypothetical protein
VKNFKNHVSEASCLFAYVLYCSMETLRIRVPILWYKLDITRDSERVALTEKRYRFMSSSMKYTHSLDSQGHLVNGSDFKRKTKCWDMTKTPTLQEEKSKSHISTTFPWRMFEPKVVSNKIFPKFVPTWYHVALLHQHHTPMLVKKGRILAVIVAL